MTLSAAAAHVGVSVLAVCRFIDGGMLPALRLGQLLLIRRMDLDTFLPAANLLRLCQERCKTGGDHEQ